MVGGVIETLNIFTFGGFRVFLDKNPVARFKTRKDEALLIYLAVNNRGYPREMLADLLWYERSQQQALSNLRVTLNSLRKRLGPYLAITRETIALHPDAPVWTDVARFEAHLASVQNGLPNSEGGGGANANISEAVARELERAVELYQGEFLEGFYLRESQGFEAWLVQERERYHRLAASAWHDLVEYHLQTGSYELGVARAAQLLRLDPYSELAHRQMMQLYAFSGRRSRALAQYEICRQLLMDEFGIEPGAETAALVEKIRTEEVGPPAAEGTPPEEITVFQTANPYKGLRAFQEEDADDFFGREALTDRVIARIGEQDQISRFLAIVGPSGSGKSSLVKAGLIPAVRRGLLPGSEKWFILSMVPGSHPFDELEINLLRVAGRELSSLREPLRRDERGILRASRLVLPSDQSELLMVIDQFEEVFTLVEDKTEARQFLESLYAAVTEPYSSVRVVITLRADFYDRPLMHSTFSTLLQDRTEVVIPLSVDELERAIRLPAERAGVSVEPGLVTAVVAEVVEQPHALPLLQYALTEIFEQRSGRRLTLEHYQAIGGVQGVLDRRAEETFTRLSKVGKDAARQLFLRLITLGEGDSADDYHTQVTRRRVLRSELDAVILGLQQHPASLSEQVGEISTAIMEVMEAFGAARLLSFDRDPITRSSTVEITHEALLREWTRLRGWLDESRGDVRMQRALGSAANEWIQAGRDPSFLLHGARLSYFERWTVETDLALIEEERAYLDASLAEREAQWAANEARKRHEAALERRSRNFLRALVAVFAVAAVVAILLSLFAFNQQDLAHQALAIATSRELAMAAINNLEEDPELSIMLSLQALRAASTRDAEDALHSAIQASRVRMTLTGHEQGARMVEFSPDGKTIATASYAGQVVVWEASSGEKLFTVDGVIARYSPDGAHLATGSKDGTVTNWNFATRDRLWRVRSHTDSIGDVHFSPNGKLLVSTSWDDSFKVWDAQTGQELFSSSASVAGSDVLHNVVFSLDGSLLFAADFAGDFSAEFAGTMRVWRVGQDWPLLNEYPSNVMSIYFSPDGRWLATAGGTLLEGIFLQDISTIPDENLASSSFSAVEPLMVPAAHDSVIHDFAFSLYESLMATGSQDGTAKIWRLSPDRADLQLTISGHTTDVRAIALSPDGSKLATASRDGTVRIWDITPAGTSEWFTWAAHADMVYRSALTLDGKYMATASTDGTAKVWDLVSEKELVAITSHGSPLFGIDISTDGSLLATAGNDNTAKIWKLNLSQEAASHTLLRTITGHAAAPAVGGLFPGLTSVDFNPDGTKLATGGVDGMAKIWDVQTGLELLSVQAHPNGNGITRVVFSPDGRRLATASDIPITLAKIWDATSGVEISSFSGHTQATRIWGMAFSPDGERVATGAGEGSLKIWDAKTGQELLDLVGHGSAVVSASFSPDGKYLLSSSPEGTARVWDTTSGDAVRVYTSPDGPLFESTFTPDGKNIIVNGAGYVYGFIFDSDELVRLAHSRLTRWFTLDECRQYLHQEECPTR
jgi:WD40 repeat protein/DNA-binding SARP family transcriptional activator